MNNQQLNTLSSQILDAAITVHKEMGPGLLESVYEYCLAKELEFREIDCQCQVYLPLTYKG
jgi:GxxExxY protein